MGKVGWNSKKVKEIPMNILIIASHMDDEVLGCGGVISKHVSNGDTVWVIFVANRIYNHQYDEQKNTIQKTHALKTQEVLGYKNSFFLNFPDERLDVSVQDIIIPLEKHVNEIKPEIVYIPYKDDNNQDHRAVFDAARVVLRASATPFIKNVYMYEVSSSTEQSPPLPGSVFSPNYYVNITLHIDKKIEAYKCYEAEKRTYPHPRSEEALRILAKKRGSEIGFEYAEAFMILRAKWQ